MTIVSFFSREFLFPRWYFLILIGIILVFFSCGSVEKRNTAALKKSETTETEEQKKDVPTLEDLSGYLLD